MFLQGLVSLSLWYVSEILAESLAWCLLEYKVDIWWYAQVTSGSFLVFILCQGAFADGDASGYNGTGIIGHSGELNTPIIYVSFNYRLNGTSFFLNILWKWLISPTVFGFLGGKEVQEAGLGNLGLYDRECICTQTKIWGLFVIQNEWLSSGYRNISQRSAETLEKWSCKTNISFTVPSYQFTWLICV